MINIERILDPDTVRECYRKDDIYKAMEIADIDKFIPDMGSSLYYHIIKNNKKIGIIMLKDFGSNSIELHGGIFKKYRGQDTAETIKECIKIFKSNTSIVFVAKVSSNNKPILSLVKKLGFVHKTTIEKGFRSGDLLLFSEV